MNDTTTRPGWRERLRRPATPAWWTQTRAQATRHWQRLAPRERRLLSWAGAIAAIALVWTLGIEPAWQTVTRLGTGLPALRAQAAQVDALIAEARTLQGAAAQGEATGDMPTELADSLRRAGLAEVVTLTAADANTWTAEVSAAPIEPLMRWLQDLPFALRMQPVTVELDRPVGDDGRPRSGVVSGAVSLAPAAPEAP